MITIGDIFSVHQSRIPCVQGSIFPILLTWLFRPDSFSPGFLSRRGITPRVLRPCAADSGGIRDRLPAGPGEAVPAGARRPERQLGWVTVA
jgi:hypothetical protein